MRAMWLPEVLRGAGLKVAIVPGWETRGRELTAINGVICHHTAGPSTGNAPSLGIVTNGRSDLPGPLSQLVLGRDGTFYVVASGRANHAGRGNWKGITDGNGQMLGIEAEATGRDTWPAIQMDAYRRGVAVILRRVALNSRWACGHKEYALPAGRKPDPNFGMDIFRSDVQRIMDGHPPVVHPPTLPDKVKPMFDPPHILQPVVAAVKDEASGGFYQLGVDGSLYNYCGSPFIRGANNQSWFAGRKGAKLKSTGPGKVQIEANTGEFYNLPI